MEFNCGLMMTLMTNFYFLWASGVVEAYEKAISELVAEKEQLLLKSEKMCADLKHDGEMNAQHLSSLETTFSDLHA